MMLSAGGFVGCTMKTSFPLTFSSIRTKISPSAKRLTVVLQNGTSSIRAISPHSSGLPGPAMSLKP